ncbi:hypothetical protein [Azotobacter beijerinckii]|uniref:hypothetical protein n=1 Tax=Azotobacter beijerinckii TaxID=170623 RepID=UPI002954837D|nr:hypothetical protein [Azotobacter beijerinckii]MDV7211463.1 hypothetical protein [Azotobacter beijerinckii]
MHDKGAQKVADGELARKGRALQSIKNILGLDDAAYQRFIENLTEDERATFDSEVAQYTELCTVMSGVYLQWSSQLLLEAPEIVASESTYDSSLIAPLGAVLLAAMGEGTSKAIPQHLRSAASKISKLADARRRFLEELYSQIRPEEKKDYGDLLKVCSPLLSAMPDLALYETYQRLYLYWKFHKQTLVKPVDGVTETEIATVAAKAHVRVTQICNQALHPILDASATSQQDSLAVRLMLASMLNRAEWESLEYERYELAATRSLLKLIQGLQTAGETRIPAQLEKEAFKRWLIGQFSTNSFSGEEQWRALKPQHLDRFYAQATWILQWEEANFVKHQDDEETLLNMCVLHLAWSYCTREKHDLRVPDVKDYDLVSGRAIESEEQVPLTRIMYQQRQLNTMVRSYQHYELSPQRLEIYSKCNRDGRRQQMHFMRSNLRDASLAQWRALTTGVWGMLQRYWYWS